MASPARRPSRPACAAPLLTWGPPFSLMTTQVVEQETASTEPPRPGPKLGGAHQPERGGVLLPGPGPGGGGSARPGPLPLCRHRPRHRSRPAPPRDLRRPVPGGPHTTRGWPTPAGALSPGEPVRLFRSQLGSRELYRHLAERFPVEDVPLYALCPDNTDPAVLQARLGEADYLLLSSASGWIFCWMPGRRSPSSPACASGR